MAHNHNHGEHNHNVESEKKLIFSFCLNLGFAIFEIIGGIYANSFAIVSDAVHDFGDSLILLVAIILNRKATNIETTTFPFGKQKLRLIGTILTSLILLTASLTILYNAFLRLDNPEYVNSSVMLLMAIVGIGVNGIGMLKLSFSTSKLDRAIMYHFLEDVLGWIAVLISSIVIHFTGLYIIDPILSIGISLFIIYGVVRNLLKCFRVILLMNPENIYDIIKVVKKRVDVKDVDVKVIEIDDDNYILCLENAGNFDQELLLEELSEFHIKKIYTK